MENQSFNTLTETLNYIEQQHHKMVRNSLGTIHGLISGGLPVKDQNVQQPVLKPLTSFFKVLKIELEHHLLMEEEIVFPLIRNLENVNQSGSSPSAKELVSYYLKHLVHEHEVILYILFQIRRHSRDYHPPLNSPPALNELYDQMRLLHADLNDHIRFENTFLFPKVDEIEARKK